MQKKICTYNILDGEQFVSCSRRESWFDNDKSEIKHAAVRGFK